MCEEHVAELRGLMEAEEKGDAEIQRLETVAGIGLVTALAFQAYIGDVKRFDNASQVANFVGFVPRVDISCSIVKYGSITKRGNGYLRTLLVMSAWSMVRSKNGGMLKAKYEYMTKSKGLSKKKAIVAIARKLTELLYALLKNGEDYKPVQTQKVLRKTAAELATEALGMAG
jgi:transposase